MSFFSFLVFFCTRTELDAILYTCLSACHPILDPHVCIQKIGRSLMKGKMHMEFRVGLL